MTQLERTEALLRENDGRSVTLLEAHARDLARRLDAVMAECDRWPVATWSETIAAIVYKSA